ncbi:MAG TPA: ATP-binding protein [Caulobacteraceae bacterium]|nr:ATP-binding protein [Caulobacteraceae bacterium]
MTYTAVARRGQAPLRFFIAVVLAIGFRTQLDNAWLWTWLGVYVVAQAVEFWALWPFRSDAPAPPVWRMTVAVGSIFVLAAVFGAVALPVWLVPGSLGPAGAVLLLAGSILNVLSLSRGSPLAFMAGAIPYAAYLMSAPLIDRALRGSDPFSVPFLLAEVLFLVAAVLVFRAAERLAEAQTRTVADLDARRAGAEASAEARSAFAAMVSHELRTPLSAILAAAGEIQRRAAEPEVRERAGLIAQGGRLMRALLDDLLDLSKLEAGRMRVELIPFDLQLLVEDVALFWSAEAHRKGLTLTLHGAETLPVRAEGDPMRLRQILNNLLSNAVKFTETGGVRLEVAHHDIPGQKLVLRACVADSGRGVGADRLVRIFTPFEQEDVSTARTHGGSGLGLAISRELARLMGGDLTVESRVGEGSRFTLLASLSRTNSASREAVPLPPPPPAIAARVLVVDDHEMGRRALSLLLSPLGASVTLAEGAQPALQLLAAERFDLVLMDVTMAGMDGLEACRLLRATPGANQKTPVLAVTGRTEAKDVEACRAAGMTGWVGKPVDARQLYDAIESALVGQDGAASAAA